MAKIKAKESDKVKVAFDKDELKDFTATLALAYSRLRDTGFTDMADSLGQLHNKLKRSYN